MKYMNSRRDARTVSPVELNKIKADGNSVQHSGGRRRAVIHYANGQAEHVKIRNTQIQPIPVTFKAEKIRIGTGKSKAIMDKAQNTVEKLITKAQQKLIEPMLPSGVTFGTKMCGNAKRVTLNGPENVVNGILHNLKNT